MGACVIKEEISFGEDFLCQVFRKAEYLLRKKMLRAFFAGALRRFVRRSSVRRVQKKKQTTLGLLFLLERITGLEPATSTLARWRSTK